MSRDEDETARTNLKQTLHNMESPLTKTGSHPTSGPPSKLPVAPGSMTIDPAKLMKVWETQSALAARHIEDNEKTRDDNRTTRFVMFGGTAVIMASLILGYVRSGEVLESQAATRADIARGAKRLEVMQGQLTVVSSSMTALVAALVAEDVVEAEEEELAAQAPPVPLRQAVRIVSKPKMPSAAKVELRKKRAVAHVQALEAQVVLTEDAPEVQRAHKKKLVGAKRKAAALDALF